MVILFVILCLLFDTNGNAVPLDSFMANVNSDILAANVCPRKRIEIVWSCVATILASSWVSVHPNLPHPDDSSMKKTLRRMELMFWAIITPELIIYWAMRQWYGAWWMEKEFSDHLAKCKTNPPQDTHSIPGSVEEQESKKTDRTPNDPDIECGTSEDGFEWTKTHGFFLQMGGFVLHENVNANRVLGWNRLMELYKAGRIDLSSITEARINDHSKADGLAKGLALLQTIWFIIQCIARFLDDHLVLTELELATAALAVLSLIMYFLWWSKPFNAETPILVILVDSQPNSQQQIVSSKSVHIKAKEGAFKLEDLKQALRQWKNILERIREMITFDGAPDSGADPVDSKNIAIVKVPTFYSLVPESLLSAIQMVWISFTIAALFGVIHCAGWFSKIHFPSHAESVLWRISSTSITGIPLICILYFIFVYARSEHECGSLSWMVYIILEISFYYMSIFTIPFYIVCRIILIVLAFIQFRDIPPNALGVIQWANILPSIH